MPPPPPATSENGDPIENSIHTQAENLQKLCKIWGFVKYTHKAFLTGEKNWDEELLKLIPVIRFAGVNEVNDILYDWYISLGDDGYDSHSSSYYIIQTKDFSEMSSQDELQWINFFNQLDELAWMSIISSTHTRTRSIFTIRADDDHLRSFLSMAENQNWILALIPASIQELDMRYMADLS